MYKKAQIILALVVILSTLLAACAPAATPAPPPAATIAVNPTTPPQPEAPTATIKVESPAATAPATEPALPSGPTSATGVDYEKKSSINDGKPVKIQLWDWFDVRAKYYQDKAAEYSKMYSNVTFEVTLLPWDEFWTKLTAALPAGQGPDVFQFHNSYHTAFVGNGFAAPYPADLFDQSYMSQHWIGMKEKHYHDAQGNIAYLPVGEMSGAIYVNKKMWDAAGLTDKDIPKTWDDLINVAKKMTKYDASGNIDISGFDFNGNDNTWGIWFDMMSQMGRYYFTNDGRGCQLDSPEAIKALDKILSFYDAKVNSKDFLPFMDAFGTEKAAMIWAFTWFSGAMKATYPNVEYFTIKEPTLAGEDLPGRGYFNYEMGLVVSSKTTDEKKKIAFDFIHWLFSNPQNLTDMAIMMDVAPAYDQTFKEPVIQSKPTMVQTIEVVPYRIFPGEIAWALESQLANNFDQAITAGSSAEDIIKNTQAACNQAMQEKAYFIVERNYLHNDKMIPDQP